MTIVADDADQSWLSDITAENDDGPTSGEYDFGDEWEPEEPRRPRDRNGTEDEAKPELVLQTLSSLVGPALDRAERRQRGEEMPVPVPFSEYAEILGGGYWPGAHFLVSGTGVGKSQFSIQTSLHAAAKGVPVVYIGLELDEAQIALRAVSEQTRRRWSGLYLGRCSTDDIARAREAAKALDGLPVYVDFGPPRGWPASRLELLAEAARKAHPTGPLLIVLDYLQIIGDEPGDMQRRPDTREKVGSAAYAARQAARRYDAAVLVISSAARAHYGLLASDAKEAGLMVRQTRDGLGRERVITHPHTLIGLGKESGEVEFSADTVTTLIRWPGQLESGETPVIAAVPKVRAGQPSWSALRFWGRFEELPILDTDELPEVGKRGGKGQPVGGDAYEERVLDVVRRHGPFKSKSSVAMMTEGNKQQVLKAVSRLLEIGKLTSADGQISVPRPPQENH